jgi:hypothetical protein
MRSQFAVAFGLSVVAAALPVRAADSPLPAGSKQSFETTAAEHVRFAPGGTIRIVNSYGYLVVEGWDEPEVQVTVTKSTDRYYDASEKQDAERRFAQIRVATERRSDTELVISTSLPARSPLFRPIQPLDHFVLTHPLVPSNRRGVTVECHLLVPRQSRLVVRHDSGYVWVSDVAGDIDVHSHTGDLSVLLPDTTRFQVDAKTRLGNITSDSPGERHYRFVGGAGFAYSDPAPSHHVTLRSGCGAITIKQGPPFAPLWKD